MLLCWEAASPRAFLRGLTLRTTDPAGWPLACARRPASAKWLSETRPGRGAVESLSDRCVRCARRFARPAQALCMLPVCRRMPSACWENWLVSSVK